MSELLPGYQAMRLRAGLLDYLTTTFALADAPARAELADFLADEADGMFKGPYLRTGMPFSSAPRRAVSPMDWMPAGFTPYAHQAAAFRRLSSRAHRPLPTLVTTGTGSGKTESFLYPIVDHCLRERRAGRRGMKALILYPMNALANDQAQRLARLLTTVEADGSQPLAGVTAALYTGEAGEGGPKATMVTPADPATGRPASLITDRAIIRDEAPDILLTNYKMLDQLLLRAEDQELWRQSAESLTYLVLDEFHTYDGAQGTDVAMLLRRLGLKLKSHWQPRGGPADNHTAEEWDRPLGRITPVGTSATLGPGDDGASPQRSIVKFATQVFGEDFDGAVVSEERTDPQTWSESERLDGPNVTAGQAVELAETLPDDATPEEIARAVAAVLDPGHVGTDPATVLRRHPFIARLLGETTRARHVAELADLIPGDPATRAARIRFVLAVFDALAHLRATAADGGPDRSWPSTEVHLWLREVTRLDRHAEGAPRFRWGDDGTTLGDVDATGGSGVAFPALYCRNCGRSGWGVELAPVGLTLAASDAGIRRNHAAGEGRFRALLTATGEEQDGVEGAMWFDPIDRQLTRDAPDGDTAVRQGRLLRVITHTTPEADDLSRADVCPSCHERDSIRFMGSAIATLMSVSIATLFGEPGLAEGEKKALVFTDSVQDAAHRAGFVSVRSHALTMRSVWRAAGQEPMSLVGLVDRVMEQADDPFTRYRIVPPSIDDALAERYWARAEPGATRQLRRRLLLDASLEFGLTGGFGRTLERTGTMSAEVDAGDAATLVAAARAALAEAQADLLTDQADEPALAAWVRGVLERMRTQGAIRHPWLEGYLKADGARWLIWGGRHPRDWMPAFPDGRSAPAFPRVGKPATVKSLLDPVTSPQSWYASWTRRCLQLSPTAAANLAKLLLEQLAKAGIVTATRADSGAVSYGLAPQRVIVAPSGDADVVSGRHLLRCDVCHSEFPAGPNTSAQLTKAPCLAAACPGHLHPHPVDAGNYYRRIYQSRDARRVNAREHTSMLETRRRLAYENGFKHSSTDPAAPNVLVATPTLEMGIDIGDLSSVFLASLPRSVANYVQRVGRAGRLSGNALNVAFVQGRGEFLPRLGEPLSLINGAVTPPATYLSAEEILRRQWLAHVADELARDPDAIHPHTTGAALPLPGDKPTFLGQLIERSGRDVEQRFNRFVDAFRTDGVGSSTLRPEAIARLKEWVTPVNGLAPLAETVLAAAGRWHLEQAETERRLTELNKRLPDLEARADDSDDDAHALRETQAEIRFLGGVLGGAKAEYWIAALERLGLFPNYSLLDDSVQLDVTMSWIDEQDGYQTEQSDYTRGRSQALSDFAPGATFYVRGLQVGIDAVDIGHQASAIRTVRLCPDCGYAAETGTPAKCPRCESSGIADVGQKFETVELTRVSAYVRRDEARIDDRDDERIRAGFNIVAMPDLDPSKVQHAWYTSTDTGVKYFHGIQLRWFNLGPRRHTAPDIQAGGHVIKGPQFRVCAACGHLDKTGLKNSRDEHRPWCPLRTSPTEQARTVLLHRGLVTQAALIRLPYQVALGDDPFALPSLTAALMLGLRQVYGGAPDHLGVVAVKDPASNNRDALLIHDTVPGGTGYLAELADHQRLWRILAGALDVLRACPCADEDRLACHRCLLPFAAPHQRPYTARSSAITHLEHMLGLTARDSTAAVTWEVKEEPIEVAETESVLERRFRKAFRAVAQGLGGTVTDIPGALGNKVRVGLGNRTFTLAPQVLLGHTQPDFLLTADGLPEIAIYTDGWEFHASPVANRIADDAAKREALRLMGYHVLAVTSHDLDCFELGEKAPAPGWFAETLAQRLNQQAALQHNSAARDALIGGPMAFLAYWLQQGDVDNLTRFGRAAATLAYLRGAPPADDLARRAVAPLGAPAQPRVWREGTLAVAVAEGEPGAMPAVALLDDTTDLTSHEARKGWAAWLTFANATMFGSPTMARVAALSDAPAAPVVVDMVHAGELNIAWQPLADELGDEALALLTALSGAGVAPPDAEAGYELGDGVPFDLVWTAERIAVQLDPDGDHNELERDGWRVFGPEAEQIIEAWKAVHRG